MQPGKISFYDDWPRCAPRICTHLQAAVLRHSVTFLTTKAWNVSPTLIIAASGRVKLLASVANNFRSAGFQYSYITSSSDCFHSKLALADFFQHLAGKATNQRGGFIGVIMPWRPKASPRIMSPGSRFISSSYMARSPVLGICKFHHAGRGPDEKRPPQAMLAPLSGILPGRGGDFSPSGKIAAILLIFQAFFTCAYKPRRRPLRRIKPAASL